MSSSQKGGVQEHFQRGQWKGSKLLPVLEAARWAPSSRNEQPWRYILFTRDNPVELRQAQSILLEANLYAKMARYLYVQ
jgi:nitroreductase